MTENSQPTPQQALSPDEMRLAATIRSFFGERELPMAKTMGAITRGRAELQRLNGLIEKARRDFEAPPGGNT